MHVVERVGLVRTSNVQSRPENSQTGGQLCTGIEIGGHQNRTGDETTLTGSNEGTGNVKRGPAGYEGLRPGHGTPKNHHSGQDIFETLGSRGSAVAHTRDSRAKDCGHQVRVPGVLRTTYIALGEELHGKLGRHEAYELDRVSVVVVVARQSQIVQ